MPIAVLSEYTEKEYEPFDPYSRFYPAMPISVCFSDTALYTLGKSFPGFAFYYVTSYIKVLSELSPVFCVIYFILADQSFNSLSDALFSSFPGSHFVVSEQSGFKTSTVLPNPLPPEVANGTTVLPEKS